MYDWSNLGKGHPRLNLGKKIPQEEERQTDMFIDQRQDYKTVSMLWSSTADLRRGFRATLNFRKVKVALNL